MMEIEKGVPMPPKKDGRPREPESLLGTLRRMEIGDSILTEFAHRAQVASRFSVLAKEGLLFSTRKMDGKIRVWRIA